MTSPRREVGVARAGGGPGLKLALVAAVFGLHATGPALAQTEVPPGAASCSGCHSGHPGVGTSIPPLFGRDPGEIAALLRAFRAEERPATIMNRLSKGFSEEESLAIAAWLGSQPAIPAP
jgi:sulfide dehydrogenase cytochrome subunit